MSKLVFRTILGSLKSLNRSIIVMLFFHYLIYSHDRKLFIESNSELLGSLASVWDQHRLFTTDSCISQIHEFFEGRIIGKNALIFRDFTDLAMVSPRWYLLCRIRQIRGCKYNRINGI